MAEYNNAQKIGNFALQPTAAKLALLKDYDKALGSVGHDRLHSDPASFLVIDLYVMTDANDNAKASAKINAPWPINILAADVACESAAGSAGVVDILVDDVSILDAAEDVKTAAGSSSRVAPEAGSEDVAYDSTIHIVQTGTGAGAMVGGQAHLYCQRQ